MKFSRKKQSFLEGAAILTMATLAVKVIGALFKIPLANILGGVGMSYFVTAYDLFTPIYSLTVTGLGVAVSRMVAEQSAGGDIAGVEAVLRAAKRIFAVIGFVGTGIILATAPWFVKVINNPAALFAVTAIAPAVIFSCISSVYRGYYQGLSNMTPTAFSQVIESVTRLVLGILLAYGATAVMTKGYNSTGQIFGFTFDNPQYARIFMLRFSAAGAIAGVTASTAVGAIYIRWRYKAATIPYVGKISSRRISETGKKLIIIAVPIALSTLVINLSALIDLVSVMNCLNTAALRGVDTIFAMYPNGIPPEISTELLPEYLYGSYSGLAYSVFNLVPAITAALGVSAIPAVSRAWASNDRQELTRTISSIMRITMLVALPAGLGIATLAKPILLFLFPARVMEVSIVAPILRVMGISAVLVAAATPINSILQSIGREKLPLYILVLGAVIKLITNYTLIPKPEINIQGVPYGTLLCYLVIIVLSSSALRLCTGVSPGIYRIFLKPLFCAIISSGSAWLLYSIIPFGNTIKLALSILAAAAIYAVMVLLTGAICKNDLKMLYVNENIRKTLEKIGFIS